MVFITFGMLKIITLIELSPLFQLNSNGEVPFHAAILSPPFNHLAICLYSDFDIWKEKFENSRLGRKALEALNELGRHGDSDNFQRLKWRILQNCFEATIYTDDKIKEVLKRKRAVPDQISEVLTAIDTILDFIKENPTQYWKRCDMQNDSGKCDGTESSKPFKAKNFVVRVFEKVDDSKKLILKVYKDKNSKGIIIYNLVSRLFNDWDKRFYVEDNCNGCGICTKICPVENINLNGKRPVWLHKCEQCMACLNWCPKGSIQYTKNTVGKKRYQNHCFNSLQ